MKTSNYGAVSEEASDALQAIDRAPDGRARCVVGARIQVLRHGASAIEVTGKAAVVLALLALEGQVERRRMAPLLWPGSSDGQARNNLRTLVHRLNQRLDAEMVAGAEHLRLDPALLCVVEQDDQTLLAALRAGGPQACELLARAGLEAEPSEALAQWLGSARQRLLRQQLTGLSETLTALLRSADLARAPAQAERAIALARACVQLEPLSERWHRQLMDTLASCGDRAAALAAYEDCKAQLREQVGVLPDMQTRTVQLRILQGQAQEQQQAQGTATSHELPQPSKQPMAVTAGLTPLGGAARYPLVEREAVLTQVHQALAQGQHVALHGEAGVGKTRLLRHLSEEGLSEQVVIRPGARSEPYAAVGQLLQEVQPRRAARIGLPEQVELARFAPLAFPGVQPSQASLWAPRLHAALKHWFEQLGTTGVKRLVLDDVHYADAASQAAFGALLAVGEDTAGKGTPRQETASAGEPAASSHTTLLLAHRSGEIDPTLEEALMTAQAHGQARSVALPRLSLQGVRALLHAMHAEQTDAQSAQLLQRTGGNPLFVIQLAQHVQERASQSISKSRDQNVDALLRSRLAGCSAAAQQLATVAAVAAQDFSVELAQAVTGQPPLALMPAWSELQRRGIFADHGLAHDLVREAALSALPSAIARTLYRQVAQYLEAQGLKGSRVLNHWLAAEDFDRALPHAVQQLHTAYSAGLPTTQLESDLLALMQRLSDAALLSNLWLSAEVGGSDRVDAPLLSEQWSALEPLVLRVERLQQTPAVTEWLAFERARLDYHKGGRVAKAYADLNAAAERMQDQGIARAWTEVMLGRIAYLLNGASRSHALRAKAALANVVGHPDHHALFDSVEMLASMFSEIQAQLRAKMATMRDARRRFDLGAAEAARKNIALHCYMGGLYPSACRYFRMDSGVFELADRERLPPINLGFVALFVGRLTRALQLAEQSAADGALSKLDLVLRLLLWLRLGQYARAKEVLRETALESFEADPSSIRIYMRARCQFEVLEGIDPLPSLREGLAHASSRNVVGLHLQLLEWVLVLQSADAHERIVVGGRLIDELRRTGYSRALLSGTLLEVAEAHFEAGSLSARTLALEASRDIRRGRLGGAIYLPDILVRCAKVLESTDPTEAAALVHVARRWVLQALPHVPDFARQSFMTDVPVNRLLLDGPA